MFSFAFEIPAWMLQSPLTLSFAGGAGAALMVYVFGRQFVRPKPPAIGPGDPVGAFASKGNADRRNAPRRKGNHVEVTIVDELDNEHRGYIVDRSVGGLCLLVDPAIEDGTVLKVRPRTNGPAVPWTTVTVRSCRKVGLQHEIGVQFDRPPDWSRMLTFG